MSHLYYLKLLYIFFNIVKIPYVLLETGEVVIPRCNQNSNLVNIV